MVKAETIKELGKLIEKNMVMDEFRDKITRKSDEEEEMLDIRERAVLVDKMFEFSKTVASFQFGRETDLKFWELMESHIVIYKKIASIGSVADMNEEDRENVANWIAEKRNLAVKLEKEFIFGK